jgi:hypothetical protein
MLHAPIFFVLGKSAARFASQRTKLESLNPSCKVVSPEAEVSLLSDVDAVCKQITAAEQKVDCLYMSPGLIPLNGPQCTCLPLLNFQTLTGRIDTKEGPEMCFAISYYSRMRLMWNHLPLLRQSPRPRVLSSGLNRPYNTGRTTEAVQHRPRGIGLAWSGLAWLETRTPSKLGRW